MSTLEQSRYLATAIPGPRSPWWKYPFGGWSLAGITDDSVNLEIAPGVITTWMKLAVRDRVVDEIDDDDTDDADYEARESSATEITDSPNTKTDG